MTRLFFRRQQLEQPVYCESESRRPTTVEDDKQDVSGTNPEKVKVSYDYIVDYAMEHFRELAGTVIHMVMVDVPLATINHVALRMRARDVKENIF